MATTWFVVVERTTEALEPLPAYALGPYATESQAAEEANSDSGIAFCLLTIDAKSEGYVADECYWTQTPPDHSIIITPPVPNQGEQT